MHLGLWPFSLWPTFDGHVFRSLVSTWVSMPELVVDLCIHAGVSLCHLCVYEARDCVIISCGASCVMLVSYMVEITCGNYLEDIICELFVNMQGWKQKQTENGEFWHLYRVFTHCKVTKLTLPCVNTR